MALFRAIRHAVRSAGVIRCYGFVDVGTRPPLSDSDSQGTCLAALLFLLSLFLALEVSLRGFMADIPDKNVRTVIL